MTDKIVMFDSPEAAKLTTITGWVSRTGQFFGDDERRARWSGCTHETCEECGHIHERGCCRECLNKRDIQAWKNAPRAPWDGKTPLYSEKYDKYFFWNAEQAAQELAEDMDQTLADLLLYICEPRYASPVSDDYFCDDLPEDGELPDAIQDAMERFNAAIKAAGPLSWTPGKSVPAFSDSQQKEETNG